MTDEAFYGAGAMLEGRVYSCLISEPFSGHGLCSGSAADRAFGVVLP